MRTDTLDYYRRRADTERQVAATCTDNAAASAHRRMADEYQKRVDDLSDRPQLALVR